MVASSTGIACKQSHRSHAGSRRNLRQLFRRALNETMLDQFTDEIVHVVP